MFDPITVDLDRDSEEEGCPPIVWVKYGDLGVAVTRSTVDGKLLVHVENITSEDPMPVRIAEAQSDDVLWEGNLI